MKINTLDKLQAKQKALKNQVSLRHEGKSSSDQIEVLVGLATCGFAVGADDTMMAIEKRIKETDIDATVVGVGCIGYCHIEPTIQVNIPGETPRLYGPITEKMAEKFVDTVLKDRKAFDDYLITQSFDKAVL
ncbi:MAG: (2Fe-2S) ferredoxin domain-containing protein [Candidatus Izemoplasma sp.]|nr:(2Fe-2S) ferredoxin domain-containing protein [Candidatus Izemoplasma sp.]